MTEETAVKNINEFMTGRRYNFSVEQLLESYSEYFKKGYYVSYTTKDSINHLTEELEFLNSKVNQ